jgi:hypothetical protein
MIYQFWMGCKGITYQALLRINELACVQFSLPLRKVDTVVALQPKPFLPTQNDTTLVIDFVSVLLTHNASQASKVSSDVVYVP